jgi:hypothetical protein
MAALDQASAASRTTGVQSLTAFSLDRSQPDFGD